MVGCVLIVNALLYHFNINPTWSYMYIGQNSFKKGENAAKGTLKWQKD